MKNVLIVAIVLVVFCGAALADWATDFDAWKAQTPEARYYTNPVAVEIYWKPSETAKMGAELDAVIVDAKAVLFDPLEKNYVREYAGDILHRSLLRVLETHIAADNKPAMLAMWNDDFKKVYDLYKIRDFRAWQQGGVKRSRATALKLVLAGVISSAQSDQQTLDMALGVTLADSAHAEFFDEVLIDLARAYKKKLLSAKDYEDALKAVTMNSIARMNTLETDDPKRAPLLTAISGVKTSLKNLQEIEADLLNGVE